MTREELIHFMTWWDKKYCPARLPFHREKDADKYLAEHPLPPAEGAEEILPTEEQLKELAELAHRYMYDAAASKYVCDLQISWYGIEQVIKAWNTMKGVTSLHAQRIAEKMVEKMSPSNEQIHEAALAWARDHSEAPDKDCPDWLIRDYEAGAYFVRQCMGCWNKE